MPGRCDSCRDTAHPLHEIETEDGKIRFCSLHCLSDLEEERR